MEENEETKGPNSKTLPYGVDALLLFLLRNVNHWNIA